MWLHVQETDIHQQKTQEEDKSKDIGSSREALSCYGWARLLPTNTKGLVKVAWILTGLKHALVFQLCWLLGRLFKLLIKLCEHSGRPCWICLQAQCLQEGHDYRSGVDPSHMTWTQVKWESWICNFTLGPAACDFTWALAFWLGMIRTSARSPNIRNDAIKNCAVNPRASYQFPLSEWKFNKRY